MPILSIILGDAFIVSRDITTLVPSGDSPERFWLAVKEQDTDHDDNALIFATMEQDSSGGWTGGTLSTDSAGNVTVTFDDLALDTLALEPDIYYFYGVKMETAAGSRITIEQGRLIGSRQIVQAPDEASS